MTEPIDIIVTEFKGQQLIPTFFNQQENSTSAEIAKNVEFYRDPITGRYGVKKSFGIESRKDISLVVSRYGKPLTIIDCFLAEVSDSIGQHFFCYCEDEYMGYIYEYDIDLQTFVYKKGQWKDGTGNSIPEIPKGAGEIGYKNFIDSGSKICLFSNGVQYIKIAVNINTGTLEFVYTEFIYRERATGTYVDQKKCYIRGTLIEYDGVCLILGNQKLDGANVKMANNQVFWSNPSDCFDFLNAGGSVNNSPYYKENGFNLQAFKIFKGNLICFGDRESVIYKGDVTQRLTGGFQRIQSYSSGCISPKSIIELDNELIYYDYNNNAIYSFTENEQQTIKTKSEKINNNFLEFTRSISNTDAALIKIEKTPTNIIMIIPNKFKKIQENILINRDNFYVSYFTLNILGMLYIREREFYFTEKIIGERNEAIKTMLGHWYPSKYQTSFTDLGNLTATKFVKMPIIVQTEQRERVAFKLSYIYDTSKVSFRETTIDFRKNPYLVVTNSNNRATQYGAFNDSDEADTFYRPLMDDELNNTLVTLSAPPTNFYRVSIIIEEELDTDFLTFNTIMLKKVYINNKYLGK
jgi:hypothetical protein